MAARKNQRALAVIRALRQKQAKQNQQIEILCQDMVSAHGQFACKLSRMNFAVGFYETLLSAADLETRLDGAAAAIQARISRANVAIFILEKQGFDIHLAPAQKNAGDFSCQQIRQWFTDRAVRNIALAGQICSAQKMLTLGMQISPAILKSISIAAIPLGILGQAVGFVLIWKEAQHPLHTDSLEFIAAVAPGLRAAIVAGRDAAAAKTHDPSVTVDNMMAP